MVWWSRVLPRRHFHVYLRETTALWTIKFYAVYYDPGETGPLETGGDFYSFFVLGLYPASFVATSDDSSATTTSSAPSPTATTLNNTAYPDPDVWQDNLTKTGYTTGYFLREQSLAVLSIPTFYADEASIDSFTDTVSEFLTKAKAAGMSKVLVDLQQNEGGDFLMAYSAFKQFFPSIVPFAGSNIRSHPLANVVGSTLISYWDSRDDDDYYHQAGSADEWIALTHIDATTGQNFTSWQALYGPHDDGVDLLSSPIRLNTSDVLYDCSALGQVYPPPVLVAPYAGDAPYAAEDIIMVSRPISLVKVSC